MPALTAARCERRRHWGEQVKAVIEPAAGITPNPALAEEILAFCAERIAKFECPT
jgi:long-chain acyl-CoA synthetase